MQVKEIKILNMTQVFEILSLIDSIKNLSFSLKDYAEYLTYYQSKLYMVGIFFNGIIIGFAQAEKPYALSKHRGHVIVSACRTNIPRKYKKQAMVMIEEWFKKQGCTEWTMKTKRNPAAFARAYNMEIMNDGEYMLGRKI